MSPRRKKQPALAALESTVALFGTLSNTLRLQLLLTLAREGEMSAGELEAAVDAEQSAVSHQLATLKRARLVTARRDGRYMRYSLLDAHVAHIVEDALTHANERR
jgi:DNA-binding transcriptional ArsR family regulator